MFICHLPVLLCIQMQHHEKHLSSPHILVMQGFVWLVGLVFVSKCEREYVYIPHVIISHSWPQDKNKEFLFIPS